MRVYIYMYAASGSCCIVKVAQFAPRDSEHRANKSIICRTRVASKRYLHRLHLERKNEELRFHLFQPAAHTRVGLRASAGTWAHSDGGAQARGFEGTGRPKGGVPSGFPFEPKGSGRKTRQTRLGR